MDEESTQATSRAAVALVVDMSETSVNNSVTTEAHRKHEKCERALTHGFSGEQKERNQTKLLRYV